MNEKFIFEQLEKLTRRVRRLESILRAKKVKELDKQWTSQMSEKNLRKANLIKTQVVSAFDLKVDPCQTGSKNDEVSFARHIGMFLFMAYELGGHMEAAVFFGLTDHGSSIYARKKLGKILSGTGSKSKRRQDLYLKAVQMVADKLGPCQNTLPKPCATTDHARKGTLTTA